MRDRIRLRAYAKINFYLDIVEKRADGYHNIETVFQSIALHDEVEIRRSRQGLRVLCSHPSVPLDESNVAIKAASRLLAIAGVADGFEIQIEKRIPVAAGLAGGSADAAAVLIGLNELLDLGYPLQALQQLGAQLGADIPFCLQGGAAIGHGIGEQLSGLPSVERCPLVIANPGFPVSTAWAFRQLNFGLTTSGKNVTILTQGLEARDWVQICGSLYNVFQPIVISHHPVVGQLLEQLVGSGAIGALMTGSGPTVYGIVPSRSVAQAITQSLEVPYCIDTETYVQGVEVF